MLPKPFIPTAIFWKIFYTVGAVSCVFGGYRSLAPERTANTNADWIFSKHSFPTGIDFVYRPKNCNCKRTPPPYELIAQEGNVASLPTA